MEREEERRQRQLFFFFFLLFLLEKTFAARRGRLRGRGEKGRRPRLGRLRARGGGEGGLLRRGEHHDRLQAARAVEEEEEEEFFFAIFFLLHDLFFSLSLSHLQKKKLLKKNSKKNITSWVVPFSRQLLFVLLVTVLLPRSIAYGLARFFARGFYRAAGIEATLAPPLQGSGPQIFRGQCCDGWFFLQKAGLLRVTTEKVVEFVEKGLVLEKEGEVEADLLVVAREFFFFFEF